MIKINTQRLSGYLDIFGAAKMHELWDEYVELSDNAWVSITTCAPKEQQRVFHCWRSNSLVFGMEDFSDICTQIEECLITNRLNNIPDLISKARKCYEESLKFVNDFLKKGE